MKVRSFLSREDALIQPQEGEEFRYEHQAIFLEVVKDGHTIKLIHVRSIVEMDIEPEESLSPPDNNF